jgi:hypothetical protein
MVNFLIIQDIYSDVIFRIVHANSVSHIFANDIVVKQSENLSNLSEDGVSLSFRRQCQSII